MTVILHNQPCRYCKNIIWHTDEKHDGMVMFCSQDCYDLMIADVIKKARGIKDYE